MFGKSEIAPKHGHIIVRLELCSNVLALEVGEIVSPYLRILFERIQYHMDSRVVLGFLQNTSRRFNVYVSNRMARIHRSSRQNQ